MTIMTMTMMM